MVAITDVRQVICGFATLSEPDLTPLNLSKKKKISFRFADGLLCAIKIQHPPDKDSCQRLYDYLTAEGKVVALKVKATDASGPFVFSQIFSSSFVEEKSGIILSSSAEGGTVLVPQKEGISIEVRFSPQSIPSISPEKLPAKLKPNDKAIVGTIQYLDSNQQAQFCAAYLKVVPENTILAPATPMFESPQLDTAPENSTPKVPKTFAGFISASTRSWGDIYCKEIGRVQFSLEDLEPGRATKTQNQTKQNLATNYTEGKWVEFEAHNVSRGSEMPCWKVQNVRFYKNKTGKPQRPMRYDRFGDGHFEIKDVKCLVSWIGEDYGVLWSPDLGRVCFKMPGPEDDLSSLDSSLLESLRPLRWVKCPVSVIHGFASGPVPNCWLETKVLDIEVEEEDSPDLPTEILKTTATIYRSTTGGKLSLMSEEIGLIAADPTAFPSQISAVPNDATVYTVYAAPSMVHQQTEHPYTALFVKPTEPQEEKGNSVEAELNLPDTSPAKEEFFEEPSTSDDQCDSGVCTSANSDASTTAPSLQRFRVLSQDVWEPTGQEESLLYLKTILPSIRSILNPVRLPDPGCSTQEAQSEFIGPNSDLTGRYGVQTGGTVRKPSFGLILKKVIPATISAPSLPAYYADPSPKTIPESKTVPNPLVMIQPMNPASSTEMVRKPSVPMSVSTPKSAFEQHIATNSVTKNNEMPSYHEQRKVSDTQKVPVQPRQVYDYGFDDSDEESEVTSRVSGESRGTMTEPLIESEICRRLINDPETFAIISKKLPDALGLLLRLNRRI